MIVKVCGMRDPENIAGLQRLSGVQWMGMIFHAASPRAFNRAQLPAVLLDTAIQRVGVFVDQPLEAVRATARNFKLHRVQLHGSESPEYCRELCREWPLIKAFRVDAKVDWDRIAAYGDSCSHFLFDTAGPQPGGNGQRFDWSLLSGYSGPTPFLLAGGIGPGDASRLQAFQHPNWAGIDLNSGFEIRAGLKDLMQLEHFLHTWSTLRGVLPSTLQTP
ncbi:MAG: phosphoribosylanthranilate isomerase [Bacteroidetes bacterium]|nr:phosphoribosylanthranilate isomerase [Bacteroidota bacterium]